MYREPVQIVMIEDDDVDVEAVVRLVAKRGAPFALTVFGNGAEAAQAFGGAFGTQLLHQPYLVLLDLNMPRMGGIEFLDWLRAQPSWRNAVVFVLTTSDAPADRRQAYARHVAGYLTKGQLGAGYSDLLPLLDALCSTVTFPTPEQ
jgi:CheY-like chemotaxis protein